MPAGVPAVEAGRKGGKKPVAWPRCSPGIGKGAIQAGGGVGEAGEDQGFEEKIWHKVDLPIDTVFKFVLRLNPRAVRRDSPL